ncbi:MAG: NADAR family protein [Phycisphaeraceae bacterium]|nr:MAG: NADAR family protein [Phycisphaeraceae bacterium]
MHDVITTERLVLFWDGWPSQWHPSPFVLDAISYNCCEQFMMSEKARMFGDLDALNRIMATRNPRKQKAFGRSVKPFDADLWAAECQQVVFRGNLAKFEQNDELRELLLATGDRLIAEASPEDEVWGIGLPAEHPDALIPEKWRGTNWLGIALMRVRDHLKNSDKPAAVTG